MYGKIGVNIFIMISGYYGITEEFSLKKVLKIEFETLFVSYLLSFISIIWLNANGISFQWIELLKLVIKTLFPTLFGSYWYVSAFIILCFLKPFLNELILSLNKTQIQGLIIIILIIWSVIPTMTMGSSTYGWNNYLWMPIPYIIGGYIKLFKEEVVIRRKMIAKIALVANIVHIFPVIIFNIVFDGQFNGFACSLCSSNSITSIIISITLLCYVISGKEKNIKNINYIAKGVFVAYLIQEHIIFRDIFWNRLMKVALYQNSNLLLILVVAVLLLMFFGIILHQIYKNIEKNYLEKAIEKTASWEKFLKRKVYGYRD